MVKIQNLTFKATEVQINNMLVIACAIIAIIIILFYWVKLMVCMIACFERIQ